jgi:hypothetical protein
VTNQDPLVKPGIFPPMQPQRGCSHITWPDCCQLKLTASLHSEEIRFELQSRQGQCPAIRLTKSWLLVGDGYSIGTE